MKGLEVASVKSRKPKLTSPRTPSTRAAKSGGRLPERIATATLHSASSRIHSNQRALVRSP